MAQLPIKLTENLKLLNLGINQNSISFATLSLDSDKYITVCEKSGETPQVVIIDVANPRQPRRHTIKADSARMNPSQNLIGLKAGKTIQVYDIEKKEKIKSYALPVDVGFWKWVTSNVIVLVTQTSVYSWTTDDQSQDPTKLFDRMEAMNACQITNFQADASFEWMALVGLSAQPNRVAGSIQLYSVKHQTSQLMEGHACLFTELSLEGNPHPSKLVAFAVRNPQGSKLNIAEAGSPPPENRPFPKRSVDLFFPVEAANDFPLSMHPDKASGLIFILTKMGYVYMYELESGICAFANRISQETVFVSAGLLKGNGFICVNRQGTVLSVSVNSEHVVPYLISKKMDDVAFIVAARAGYPGAESAFVSKFNGLFDRGNYAEAARVAAMSTGSEIRNGQTIARFRALPQAPGTQAAPLFSYFATLLENGRLNALESLELCRLALMQGKKVLVEKWLKEDKLECSEELGDLAKPIDSNLALSVYLRSNCHAKVVQSFAEAGQFDKIFLYAQKVGFLPDYARILRSILYQSPEAGLRFAVGLVQKSTEGLDIAALAGCFTELNLNTQCTTFLLEALKEDRPEHAELQTRLLELSLQSSPQVAEAIFANKILTHFDRSNIARLCEQVGLVQRALQFYTDMFDIKRAIVQTQLLNPDWLVTFFGSLSVDDSLSCLRVLLEHDRRRNIDIVVHVAAKYEGQLGTRALVALFEECKSTEGLFKFLHAIVWNSTDPEVHFKYVQASCKTNHFKELERICRESTYFEPEPVKNFLKEARLSDQIPLITVCDRFDMVEDMVLHLHKNNMLKHVETYVHKVNPSRLPEIIGALLDVDCAEEFLAHMMLGCPPNYDIDRLVSVLAERNRISLLRPVVEARIASGSTEPAVHTALAIVCIDQRSRPEVILRDNPYYDSLVVGRYCENRDPRLALIAYARGSHDDEYMRVCVANSRFKELARHVISQKSTELWARALDPANDWRRTLMDQASQAALAEVFDPECISEMVKALMAADLPSELVALLEKLVLADSPYRSIKNLQNLLLLTAVKSHPGRLLDYINRLDNFDAPQIAAVALSHNLCEEAFAVYKKFDAHAEAVRTLAVHLGNFDRATEYAERVNIPASWSVLGSALLEADRPREALEAFTRAEDFNHHAAVIAALSSHPIHEQVLKYLAKVRTTFRDTEVDSKYAYCLAHTGALNQLRELLDQPNSVGVVSTGDLLFEEGRFEAAKILFSYANNFSKLVATHVKLNEFQQAVEMARKANSSRMWREVCLACLDAEEFRFAQTCGLALVVHPEELESLVAYYEKRGLYDALLTLVEAAITLERAHMGVFTELAVLYAKYRAERLRDYIDLHWARLNIPKALKAAETYRLWAEVVFLYDKYEEYDSAALTMLRHPSAAFSEPHFRELITKVASQDVYHKAISFYHEYKPLSINELLMALSHRLDHTRAIAQLRELDVLSLCRPYLIHVQRLNMAIINETLNDIFIDEVAHQELRVSIESYSNFDAAHLAERLEGHDCVELRRISAIIRKVSNRWNQAVEMAKQDGLHGDAVLYAAESRDPALARSLLDHFVSIKRHDHLVSLLYLCYDLLEPDAVLEVCWLGGVTEVCMPFFIQHLRDCTEKVSSLESRTKGTESTTVDDQPQYSLPAFTSSSIPRLTVGDKSKYTAFPTPVPDRGSSNYPAINPFR